MARFCRDCNYEVVFSGTFLEAILCLSLLLGTTILNDTNLAPFCLKCNRHKYDEVSTQQIMCIHFTQYASLTVAMHNTLVNCSVWV